MNKKYKIGRSKIRVMRKEINEQTGREEIKEIHRGILIGGTSSFLRVFNNERPDRGGDISQYSSEVFPEVSKRCWCEPVDELDEAHALFVPYDLR